MASSIRSDGLQLGVGKFSEVSPESDLRGAAARAAGQMPLQYDLTVGDLVVAATAWKGVMVGDAASSSSPGEDLPHKRCRIKFDDGKGTYVYTKGQQARRVPILGGYDALLVRFPNGVDAEISAGRARPASVVVVPGAPPIFKGDVVLALVDYETVTVGDRGVVVGPCCDPAMSRPDLRVLVDFENKAAYNFRSDAHLRLARAGGGHELCRGDKVILPGLDKKVIGVVIGVGRCAGTLAVKGYDALPRDVAYNEVRVGDRGVVVGPCMQPEMQNAAKRVLVDFGRKGVYNYHVDKQLACVHGDEDARRGDSARRRRDTWTKIEDMPGGERYGIASGVDDGKLFIFGGRYEDNERSNELFIYDGKKWKRESKLPSGGSHQHGVIFDGKFYLIGGLLGHG
ncbi:hypothetical protein SO694_00068199 [Aureococcus anophagefferens]|uniref:Uncharacterized protein n=1 Tax=Aureococcus anophagefferens TaxID=44056 RepID=A0ABR1FPW6_AURAN